jgi:hypothetical protein
MSAGQELLLRRSLTERFVPLVSARVPLFGPMTGCLRGRDRGWANVTANLPNDAFTISSNCGRDGHKNPDANGRFLPDLTIFRMNTCTKRVGGWGVLAQPFFRQNPLSAYAVITRAGLGAKCAWRQTKSGPRDLQLAFSGAAEPRRACLENQRELAKGRFQGCGFSAARPRIGVQLHPRRGCATVRLKVPVRNSREAAVPCAHI